MAKTKLYTFYMGLYGATTCIQNGVSGSYMDAVLAHEESVNLTNLPHTAVLPRKAYYSSQVSRVYVTSV